MPRVNALREESTRHPYSPEDIPLLLPSQLNGKAACSRSFEVIEFQLREGQAHDALNDLRQGLRSRAYILKFKNRFLRGQGSNTRAWNGLKTLDTKINATATKYRVAHRSLTTLSASLGWVGWQDKLRPLLDEDICSLTDAFDLQPGEGRCQVRVYSGRGSGQVRTETDEGREQRAGQEVSPAGVGDRVDSTTKDNEC